MSVTNEMRNAVDPAPAELRIGSGAVVGAVPTAVQVYEYGGEICATLEEKRRKHLRCILEVHGISNPGHIIDILIHDLEALTAVVPCMQAWKTTDGTIYRTHAEAEQKQARLNHMRNLTESVRRALLD